ncbi:MAG: putative ABC transport system permease protein [Saprospiraceae bacterium]|jgi:putative ABC transport system permease protein
MNILENIRIAIDSIRSNFLRAALTFLIIAIGIMALVGILTALDSVYASLSSNLSSMGANTFNVVPSGQGVRGGGRRNRKKVGKSISYRDAMEFKERLDFPATVSVSAMGTSLATVKNGLEQTNPNVVVYGADEYYLAVAGYEVELGRNFTSTEINNGQSVAIIGQDLVNLLFDEKMEKAIGSTISIRNIKYRVIGVLKSKGSSMSQSGDKIVMIPLLTVKRYYGSQTNNYNLTISVKDAIDMDAATAATISTFRNIRKIRIGEDNNFDIQKSDSLFNLLEENTSTLRLATILIGLITLLGAAIGLMNIMLVSVTERTREIGIRKALGASSQAILSQFLTEAVVICQLGGIIGIILGIGIGNIVSFATGGSFVIPWLWMIMGVIVCLIVGLVSGLYPAMKAAKLDPIEALRYE